MFSSPSLQERTVLAGPSRKALILWASWQDITETVGFEAGLVPALVCGGQENREVEAINQ
jgi:hypothetical protein